MLYFDAAVLFFFFKEYMPIFKIFKVSLSFLFQSRSTLQKMDYYRYYRSWMYDRTYPGRTGLKPNFEEGVKGFIAFAVAQETYRVEEGI
jgi:hypothetical protein